VTQDDRGIVIFDSETQRATLLVPNERPGYRYVAFAVSSDRSAIATQVGSSVALWRKNTVGVFERQWTLSNMLGTLQFDADARFQFICKNVPFQGGHLIATIAETATGKIASDFGGPFGDRCLGFDPDGQHVVVSRENGELQWIEARSAQITRRVQVGRSVRQLVFSHDKSTFYTVDDDSNSAIRVWRYGGEAPVATLTCGIDVNRVNISADGRHVVSAAADNLVRICDVATAGERVWFASPSAERDVEFGDNPAEVVIYDTHAVRRLPWTDDAIPRTLCERLAGRSFAEVDRPRATGQNVCAPSVRRASSHRAWAIPPAAAICVLGNAHSCLRRRTSRIRRVVIRLAGTAACPSKGERANRRERLPVNILNVWVNLTSVEG
jgi:WD40 repeat protein